MQQAPVSLERACAALTELWSPRVVGRVEDQYIKVVKVLGEFPWHSHAAEDEMFLVLRGCLCIGRSDVDGGAISVRPGEFFVVPKGVRHNTAAAEETWIVLIEPVSTLHTGGERTERTRSIAEQMSPLLGLEPDREASERKRNEAQDVSPAPLTKPSTGCGLRVVCK